jgi:hypothetical protein
LAAATVTKKKLFIALTPGPNVTKKFMVIIRKLLDFFTFDLESIPN